MRVEKAYAKINTYLNVISKREDGYHNIVSVMQTVSLFDLVSVDFFKSDHTQIELTVLGNEEIPANSKNLAWRAAEMFLENASIQGKVCIRIEKNIPIAGGLAGGSADAAAVFRALYGICNAPFPLSELYALGAKLGADIPFCIRGGCSLVEGIGERLSNAPQMPHGAYLVISRLGEGISTPAAYGELDLCYGDFESVRNDQRHLTLLDAWGRGDLFSSFDSFFNIFEPIVSAERPCVKRIKDIMTENGASIAMMSGSGPSVFGIFSDKKAADQACRALRKNGAFAAVCEPCGEYVF